MVSDLSAKVGTKKACNSFSTQRYSYYYWKHPAAKPALYKERKLPDFAYTPAEKQEILNVMNSDIYMNQTPYEIYASQLDAGEYRCSVRTMYRILSENDQVKERRKVRRSNNYQKPELLSNKANQIWSWDITKLKGPEKWTYFYLYVIIDIFGRFVVGWMVAYREFSSLARQLIEETCRRKNIEPGQLTIPPAGGSRKQYEIKTCIISFERSGCYKISFQTLYQ